MIRLFRLCVFALALLAIVSSAYSMELLGDRQKVLLLREDTATKAFDAYCQQKGIVCYAPVVFEAQPHVTGWWKLDADALAAANDPELGRLWGLREEAYQEKWAFTDGRPLREGCYILIILFSAILAACALIAPLRSKARSSTR